MSLQQERLKYRPEISDLFNDLNAVGISDCGSDITFEKGEKTRSAPLRVGIVLSGGPAPGGHNVIAGVFDALQKFHPTSRLFGFLDGPRGIILGKHRELTSECIASYRNTGGFDLIGSGRDKIETAEQFQAAHASLTTLSLDGLIVVGGDDSNTNAALLATYLEEKGSKIAVIGVPKTIDGDLKNEKIEISFGFDTASKVYSEMIGNIAKDALSAKKYYHFIKLMGRSASHLTLECALQTHPNLVFIGEEVAQKKWSLSDIISQIVTLIKERAAQGKHYGVILIPEGLIEFIGEIKALFKMDATAIQKDPLFKSFPEKIQGQLLMDRDPHGNIALSHIATEQLLIALVKKEYEEKFFPLRHFFGYEGRCSFPSNFDANYCYTLGITAALLVRAKKTGYMATVSNLAAKPALWQPKGILLKSLLHLEERKGMMKPVIKKALVDLKGEPFLELTRKRAAWRTSDDYQSPGPIQFMGKAGEARTCTLELESTTIGESGGKD